MAVLDPTARARIWTELMRWWSDLREGTPYTKAQLSAAVDAADQWCDDNATSYNSALPTAFRNGATATQKTLLLVVVMLKRAGLLRLFRGED